MTQQTVDAIHEFVKVADAVTQDYWTACNYTHTPAPKHEANFISSKWCKIVTPGSGVYCFIAVSDFVTKELGQVTVGGIYKAASWSKPAKHARGNVLTQTPDDYRKALGPHGPNYLR
jgi:hypothetical protein